jgi:hypothetical protein
MGSKVRGSLGELVSKLKVLSGETGRKITQYYQFSNNYIHEFISYSRLVSFL